MVRSSKRPKSDTQVYNKYYEAIKVLIKNTAQSSWENHTDYLRVEVGSDAYMQALADGVKLIDQDDRMRILGKPKTNEIFDDTAHSLV